MIGFSDHLEEQEIMNEALSYLDEALIQFGGKKKTQFGQVLILAGGAGCYPKGTEFFNGFGWKKIEDFTSGDKVLQFNTETGIADLTTEVSLVDLPVDKFYNINNKRVDFTTSLNHKHLVVMEKTGLYKNLRTHEILEKHNTLSRGVKARLVTSFIAKGGKGLNMSDDEIRLRVALLADSSNIKLADKNAYKRRFNLKKSRKIDRLKMLLDRNNIIPTSVTVKDDGYTVFEFYWKDDEKVFENWWYEADQRQLILISEECVLWDGSITEREDRKNLITFSSNYQKSVDFIQYVFSATGSDTSIHIDEREGRNTNYSVYKNNTSGVGISKNMRGQTTTTINEVFSENGRMYCLTVPTGHFVVRQNKKIYVSGNSGKGFVIDNLISLQGKAIDVDALKVAIAKAPKLTQKIKDDTGTDITQLNLKTPQHVFKLHSIIADILNLPNRKDQALYTSILAAHPDRKPNLIFDVTLKSLSKLESISQQVQAIGYKKENIHIVWVVNDIEVAKDQNKKRNRSVPEEILVDTHRGASMTMQTILDMGDRLKNYMDGMIYVAFNKVKIDSKLETSKRGGKYISMANYIKVKDTHKPQVTSVNLPKELTDKINSYTPPVTKWGK